MSKLLLLLLLVFTTSCFDNYYVFLVTLHLFRYRDIHFLHKTTVPQVNDFFRRTQKSRSHTMTSYLSISAYVLLSHTFPLSLSLSVPHVLQYWFSLDDFYWINNLRAKKIYLRVIFRARGLNIKQMMFNISWHVILELKVLLVYLFVLLPLEYIVYLKEK